MDQLALYEIFPETGLEPNESYVAFMVQHSVWSSLHGLRRIESGLTER